MNNVHRRPGSCYSTWLILIALFMSSVAIRLPNINRPLSTNYEWVTAHTLVTLHIWFEEGIISNRFSPVYTYSNPNDHYIKCPPSGIADNEGNYYYVSYPPFSFILPFLTFKLLGIYPTALSLQIFNLFFHFFCGLLIYGITSVLIERKFSQRLCIPALVSFCVYTFSSSPLWYHSNVYFADILVQFFFLLSTFVLVLILRVQERVKKPYWLLLASSVFLMIYSEWLGVFFSSVAIIICFLLRKKNGTAFKCMLIITFSSACAIFLILVQYLSINGIEVFLDLAQNRLIERSGHGESGRGTFYALDSHLHLLRSYAVNYFPHFAIVFFLIIIRFIYKQETSLSKTHYHSITLALTIPPVILHHLVFFQFTIIHDIALLKSCVSISIIIGLLYHRARLSLQSEPLALVRAIPAFVIIILLSLSTYNYYSHIITPDEYFSKRLGNQIKNSSSPDETIFFKTTKTLGWAILKERDGSFVIAPQIHYYSGRCIQTVPDLATAQSHLRKFNKQKGIVYTIQNPAYRIERIDRISADEDLIMKRDSLESNAPF